MKDLVNDGFAKVVKPYIDAQNKKDRELVAPVEVSPAEAAHSVGDQIIFNGLLYNVTAQIAVGDSLSASGAGANISAADNIEAQIKATKSQIQTAAAQAASQNKNTQEMLAPVEEDETDASRAYEVGDQLIFDGILYIVIDPIAQHGIITTEGAGANIEEADTITEQLDLINDAVEELSDSLGTVTTKTLAANATSISFDVPTSGNNLIDFYISDGSWYTAIDTSVSGTVTLTFDAVASARTISCRIGKP